MKKFFGFVIHLLGGLTAEEVDHLNKKVEVAKEEASSSSRNLLELKRKITAAAEKANRGEAMASFPEVLADCPVCGGPVFSRPAFIKVGEVVVTGDESFRNDGYCSGCGYWGC